MLSLAPTAKPPRSDASLLLSKALCVCFATFTSHQEPFQQPSGCYCSPLGLLLPAPGAPRDVRNRTGAGRSVLQADGRHQQDPMVRAVRHRGLHRPRDHEPAAFRETRRFVVSGSSRKRRKTTKHDLLGEGGRKGNGIVVPCGFFLRTVCDLLREGVGREVGKEVKLLRRTDYFSRTVSRPSCQRLYSSPR